MSSSCGLVTDLNTGNHISYISHLIKAGNSLRFATPSCYYLFSHSGCVNEFCYFLLWSFQSIGNERKSLAHQSSYILISIQWNSSMEFLWQVLFWLWFLAFRRTRMRSHNSLSTLMVSLWGNVVITRCFSKKFCHGGLTSGENESMWVTT